MMFVERQRWLRLECEQDSWQCLVRARHPANDDMRRDAGDERLKSGIGECSDRRPFDVGKFIGIPDIRAATEEHALVAAGLTGDDERAD
jgi:hypothetical protein